ncbi:MAG TPA: cysteine desulfurase family protein [Acidimicrobiia bacterium]|nr:cysteine desulfurase family protein [Acidimicrobiia bacterium]
MVYLDHAASTPLLPAARAAMERVLEQGCANPSGMHGAARASKSALEAAREALASTCGCEPREIVFTGGGSESDNLAVKGAAWAARETRGADGIVTSAIEHKAVLGSCSRLEHEGFRVARVRADAGGRVDLDALADALDERTAVVSVMLVNNETGVTQPVGEMVDIVRARAPLAVIHTDAIQGFPWLDLRQAAAGAQLVTISGHKIGGPQGVGALVVRDGVTLVPLVDGGGHEGARRAGTQNVAGVAGLGAASLVTDERRESERRRIGRLRDRFQDEVARSVPGFALNGDPTRRVAGILNCAFAGVEAETLLVALDQHHLCASSGSACTSGAVNPSHVLVAMGLPAERARTSIRFSLGHTTTDADIDEALEIIPRAVQQILRAAA